MNQEQKRQLIETQMRELHQKIIAKPGPNDPMHMTGFLSTLILGKMTVLMLKADFERQKGEQE